MEPGDRIPGLLYVPDFVTSEEERELLKRIDDAPWNGALKRRVQHYGWRYDYRERRVDKSMRLGDLPDWAACLAQRLVSRGLWIEGVAKPDQVIVNEYLGRQGISPHVDQPRSFAEPVATLSLLETWAMVFRGPDGLAAERPLERRSVAILTGEARYVWKHGIPSRMSEPAPGRDGGRIPRGRRVSMTFRKVRPGSHARRHRLRRKRRSGGAKGGPGSGA